MATLRPGRWRFRYCRAFRRASTATDVVVQMVRRAASPGFESWWRKAENVGFCANPIHLSSTDIFGRQHQVWTRCNNRRAVACPSCSDLYARDTWQLIHAGLHGGHHDMPATVAEHPQVFATLTAPSFGAVHTSGDDRHGKHARRCHDSGPPRIHSVSARETAVVQHHPRRQ